MHWKCAKPGEIVRVCDGVLGAFAGYDLVGPENGLHQAKPAFDAWKGSVSLAEARVALTTIRDKAAALVVAA